jgi:hypothetical protein
MIEILRTSKMEDAARALHAKFPRVLIRYRPILPMPIRIRPAKLADLNLYYGKAPAEFDTQIAEWEKKGGTILYMRSHQKSIVLPPHDAQLFTECPLSIAVLEEQTRETGKLAVIYRPPEWRAHEEAVFDRFPTAAKCKRLFAEIKAGKPHPVMSQALNLPPTAILISDEAIRDSMELTNVQFLLMRGAMMKGRDYKTVIQLKPRIEPEDKYLMPAYEFITKECPLLSGHRLLLGNALSKSTRYWRRDLRGLVRSGAVERKETLGFYFLDGLEPDWLKIEAEHQAARSRLTQIVKLVDGAKEMQT